MDDKESHKNISTDYYENRIQDIQIKIHNTKKKLEMLQTELANLRKQKSLAGIRESVRGVLFK